MENNSIITIPYLTDELKIESIVRLNYKKGGK